MNTFSVLQINTDGGSRGNPGPSAVGVYASSEGQEVFSLSEYIGVGTNNEAEYKAVILALKHLVSADLKVENLLFVLDSELIVKQITGLYKVKQPHLQSFKTEILILIKNLNDSEKVSSVKFVNVLREKNKEADRLVNLALDSQK